ncbi:hypothetical protein F4775DRAFT_533403 [Biscogniauxia sp. FL1348]|nr:hypothetical protein F4775DRAFT_533403 [Biscogniauxia sp. FL1348]
MALGMLAALCIAVLFPSLGFPFFHSFFLTYFSFFTFYSFFCFPCFVLPYQCINMFRFSFRLGHGVACFPCCCRSVNTCRPPTPKPKPISPCYVSIVGLLS